MLWTQVDDYHIRSDCGRYTVCRKHTAGAVFYEAWRGRTFLASAEDPDSSGMRRVCEEDAQKACATVHHHENGDGV